VQSADSQCSKNRIQVAIGALVQNIALHPEGGRRVYTQGARGLVCGPAFWLFRSESQFSNRCTTTKNVGTNSTARQVEAIIPENTVMPIDLRALALAPAPLATTSGTTPRMKANDVIGIGRNRARAASGIPLRPCRANSICCAPEVEPHAWTDCRAQLNQRPIRCSYP
jgi:hypothetical protein